MKNGCCGGKSFSWSAAASAGWRPLGAARAGRAVRVLEQAPEFGEIGAGIQLAPNATAALDRLQPRGRLQEPRYRAGSDDWGTPEELDAVFAGLCPEVRDAGAMLQRHVRWPMYDRLPIARWTRNRITLLGDAAHPMLQYIAQGGCQALEDAVCLAEQLASRCDLAEAFSAYERERAPRTARVQRTARRWGEICHVDGIGRELRNALLGGRAGDDYDDVEWLYGRRQPLEAIA